MPEVNETRAKPHGKYHRVVGHVKGRKMPNAARRFVNAVKAQRARGVRLPKAVLAKAAKLKPMMNKTISGTARNRIIRTAVRAAKKGASVFRRLRSWKRNEKRHMHLSASAITPEANLLEALIEGVARHGISKEVAADVLSVKQSLFGSPVGCAVAMAALSVQENARLAKRFLDLDVSDDGFAFVFSSAGSNDLSEEIEAALSKYGDVEIVARPGDQIDESYQSDVYFATFFPSDEFVQQMDAELTEAELKEEAGEIAECGSGCCAKCGKKHTGPCKKAKK